MQFTGSYPKSKGKATSKSASSKGGKGSSTAAWKGLENNKRGDATQAYVAVRSDAERNHYTVTKTQAAMIAKKHPNAREAVARARELNGVVVSKKTKSKKKK